MPVTCFSEPDIRGGDNAPTIWTWFAQDETRPLMFFAGIWRDWVGRRGTKANPETGNHLPYSFLTSEAAADVAEIHPDATPVLLTTEEAQETWLNEPWDVARDLQKPLKAGSLRLEAFNTKKDDGKLMCSQRPGTCGPDGVQLSWTNLSYLTSPMKAISS